jgi:gamma-glutamyltranspeptidase/glutathione hydrolase
MTLVIRLRLLAAAVLASLQICAYAAALESSRGMVVSAQHEASDVGAAILRSGGNAVDAAVAMGYALAVTHPCCGNLGGGGFMTLHLADGRNVFLNFREKAPLAARAGMYLDEHGNAVTARSIDGYLAVGIPGTVMGLETARERYGSMDRAALLAPAIALAEHGFALTQADVDVLAAATAAFRRQPNVAAVFLAHGAALRAGYVLVQKNLAATLRAIADGGPNAFYRDSIADALVAASRSHGGLLTRADFAAYTVTDAPPVTCNYRGYTVVASPPPSSGGVVLCEMLRILEGYDLRAMGFHSADSVHVMTEAMRFAYRDRNTYLGDPAFVQNPVERLLSPPHIGAIRAAIRPRRATPSSSLPGAAAALEQPTTTHYSVIDATGNAVSVTYTINDDFGAKVIAGNTGFFLNDEMDDFTAKPGTPNMFGLVQGDTNAIAPGKRPLSSMTPTIVLKDGKPFLILGAPGGSRITTTVLEILVNVIDHEQPLQLAVDAPRLHHQWLPDTLAGEPQALDPATAAALREMGYEVVPLEPWGTGNAAEAIGIAYGPSTAVLFTGASDSRAPAGSAAAP